MNTRLFATTVTTIMIIGLPFLVMADTKQDLDDFLDYAWNRFHERGVSTSASARPEWVKKQLIGRKIYIASTTPARGMPLVTNTFGAKSAGNEIFAPNRKAGFSLQSFFEQLFNFLTFWRRN